MNTHHQSKTADQVVKEIKRRTRRIFSSEEKIKIVLEGLRGEDTIAGLCRKYGIHQNNYYNWSKDFMEAGKRRLNGDTIREANTEEVKELRRDIDKYKKAVGELFVDNRELKKSLNGLELQGS